MRKTRRIIILIILLIIQIVRYYIQIYSPLSKQSLSTTLILTAFALIVYFSNRDSNPFLRGNFFKVSVLFVVGFVLVHFFRYLGFVLGEYDDIIELHFVDSTCVNGAAICASCSLIACLIGYLSTSIAQLAVNKDRIVSSVRPLTVIMIMMMITFCLTVGRSYFRNGSGAVLNSQEGLPVVADLCQVWALSCHVAICMVVYYKNEATTFKAFVRSFPSVYYVAVVVFLTLIMLSGDRGPLFHYGVSYFATFFMISKKKFRLFYAVVVLIVASMFFSLLGTMRAMDNAFAKGSVAEAVTLREERFESESFIFSSTEELSNIIRAYHVLYDYALKGSYFYGLGTLNQLLGIVPGLRYFLYPIIGFDATKVTTAYLSTRLLDKDHGMGTTCVGDVFINFGFVGTLLVFVLFGIFLRMIDVNSYRPDANCKPIMLAFCLSYILYGIYLGRSTLFTPFNVAIYSWVLYLLNKKIRRVN